MSFFFPSSDDHLQLRSQDALSAQHARARDRLLEYYSDAASQRDPLTGLPLPPPSLPRFVPHDDLLFLFFVCGLATIPFVWSVISLIWQTCSSEGSGGGDEKEEPGGEQQAGPPQPQVQRWRRALKVMVIAVYVALLRYTSYSAGFCNPWPVLGLPSPPASTVADAKRAFRRLSKLHHPDKVAQAAGGGAQAVAAAEASYQQLLRAYKAIVPDGAARASAATESLMAMCSSDTRVLAIGLPSWLEQPENVGAVIALYGLFLGGVFLAYLAIRRCIQRDARQQQERMAELERERRTRPWRCPDAACGRMNEAARMHCASCDARRNIMAELAAAEVAPAAPPPHHYNNDHNQQQQHEQPHQTQGRVVVSQLVRRQVGAQTVFSDVGVIDDL